MTTMTFPCLVSVPDELILADKGDIRDYVAAHANLHEVRATMTKALKAVTRLKDLIRSMDYPELMNLYGDYKAIDQDIPEMVEDHKFLVSWGRSLDAVLDVIHSNRRLWEDTYELCVRSSLSRLGEELGRSQRVLGLPLGTAMALAYRHGSDYRRTLLDGRQLVLEDAGNPRPDFLAGFVSGHMDKDIPSKKDVEQYRKAFCAALSSVDGMVIDYLYGSDPIHLYEVLAPIAEKQGVTVTDLIPVVEYFIQMSHPTESGRWIFEHGQFKQIARKEAAA